MSDSQTSTCEALRLSASPQDLELATLSLTDPIGHEDGYPGVSISTGPATFEGSQVESVDHADVSSLAEPRRTDDSLYYGDGQDDALNSVEPSVPSAEALNPSEPESAMQPPPQSNEHAESSSHDSTPPKRKFALQRMSTQTVLILSATLLLILIVFAFLAFLWTAPHGNKFWHLIVATGWANSAVTASALLLRTAVDLQAGFAVAMLAAVFLEADVCLLLTDAAQVSKLRSGKATSLDIVLPTWNAFWYANVRHMKCYIQSIAVLLLLTTTVLLQFTSTILVSDLSLGTLPGMPFSTARKFDFDYQWTESDLSKNNRYHTRAASVWQQNPPGFPSFAEFSEAIDVPEHVDDTGRKLRALLPFRDAQSREMVSKYSGKAFVLDARVSCQPPRLEDLRLGMPEEGVASLELNGTFSNTEKVSQLLDSTIQTAFSCYIGVDNVGYTMTICQVGLRRGGSKLFSDLQDSKRWYDIERVWNRSVINYEISNAAHLVFKVTPTNYSCDARGSGPVVSKHGAWTDYTNFKVPSESDGCSYVNMSVSLCYPALWTARLDVELQSSRNRTEPAATSYTNLQYRTEPDLHVQMGEVAPSQGKVYVTGLTGSWNGDTDSE